METSNPDTNTAIMALLNEVKALQSVVEKLQSRVDNLSSSNPTPMSSNDGIATPTETTSTMNTTTSATTEKSEKHPDPPMFTGTRKDLRPFVTKLRLKLHQNSDRYPTESDKVNYGISRLDGDAARTMDPFYRNGTFNSFENFIALLERTYDDVSREHTAATKLETLRQRNREFTSFFSEFLGLVGELDWNEAAKVAALRRAISDEIRA